MFRQAGHTFYSLPIIDETPTENSVLFALFPRRVASYGLCGPDVELICELRALPGEAWFEGESPRLVRKRQALNCSLTLAKPYNRPHLLFRSE